MSGWSLRTKLLVFVVGAVVLPLTVVGVWLARSTQRAAATLVSSQLDSIVAQTANRVHAQWTTAVSDVRLLARNAPVVAAMDGGNARSTMPRYVDDALTTMPAITNVVFRRRDGSARWRVRDGDAPGSAPRLDATSAGAPGIPVREPIFDLNRSVSLGRVDARVLVSALLPSEAPRAPAQAIVALYDRGSRNWVGASAVPETLLTRDRFAWNGQQWLAARRSIAAPAVDLVAAAPVDPVATPFARAAAAGIAALAVVAICVVLVAAVGARRLTASLHALSIAADAVAQGDFGLEIAAAGDDEVGRVAAAFNTMRGNVRTMMSERSQREALAALGELSATVAHQIRTPLTAMRIDLQRVEEMVDGDAAGLVAHAISGADRIESAVHASLVMARTGAARFEPLRVTTLLEEAATNASPRAAARGVALALPGDEAGYLVRGDRGALVQMLTNILINGVDAAQREVRVTVGNGEHVTIEVADDGPGIPPAELPRVGEPFYSTRVGGTGLGLTIARRVLDAHRGRFTVTSTLGEGTRVRIELPA